MNSLPILTINNIHYQQLFMTVIVFLSLIVLILSLDCPVLSPNCNANSCAYTASGEVNCTSCANNAFSLPLVVNGVNYTENGNYVWTCELCSTATPNCLACSYDPNVASQVVCSSCLPGYAAVDVGSSYTPSGSFGTCQPCQSNCLSCQVDSGLSSACGANVDAQQCGTNGIICGQCEANYVNVNMNCYYCPPVSTVTLSSSSTQNNGLVVGLIIWIILSGSLSAIFIVLYLRSRSAKEGNNQPLLNTEIEISGVRQ